MEQRSARQVHTLEVVGSNPTSATKNKFLIMTAIDNSGLLNICNNCGAEGFVPAINYSFDAVGYTSAPAVTFTGGAGSGAAATATVVNGRVTAIAVTNGGSGYTSAPTVSLPGGATATATITGDAVTAVTVTNSGTGKKVKLTDASTFGAGDDLQVINVTVSDHHGNVKNGQITTAAGSVEVDLASNFNFNGGFNIQATIVTDNRVVADLSVYDVYAATATSNALGNTDIQGDVDGE